MILRSTIIQMQLYIDLFVNNNKV